MANSPMYYLEIGRRRRSSVSRYRATRMLSIDGVGWPTARLAFGKRGAGADKPWVTSSVPLVWFPPKGNELRLKKYAKVRPYPK